MDDIFEEGNMYRLIINTPPPLTPPPPAQKN